LEAYGYLFMAEGKKSFLLYTDLIHVVEKLSDEQAGKLMKHLLRYVNDQDPVMDDFVLDIVFEPIKQTLKRQLKEWEEVRKKRIESGKIGGINSGKSRGKKQNKANEASASKTKQTKQDEANEAVNVNGNVSVNVSGNDNVNEKKGENTPHPMILWIEHKAPRVQKMKEPINTEEAERLSGEYSETALKKIFLAMHNHKKLLANNVSANLTARNWLKRDGIEPSDKKEKTVTIGGYTVTERQLFGI